MVITVVSNFLFCFFSLEIEIELELYGLRKEVLLKQEELAHNPEPESNLISIPTSIPYFAWLFFVFINEKMAKGSTNWNQFGCGYSLLITRVSIILGEKISFWK